MCSIMLVLRGAECDQYLVSMAVEERADSYGGCWQIRWHQRRNGNDNSAAPMTPTAEAYS